MGIRRRRGFVFAALIAATAVTAGLSAPDASAGVKPGSPYTAKGLQATSTVSGAKSSSGKLAQTDPKLLGRKDSTRVNVVVKLDYDATAAYKGDVRGFAATSPSVTG